MMNIYTGNVILDGTGAASVRLPEWFEALNGDFRYQLTAIGAAAPNLHIAEGFYIHPALYGQPDEKRIGRRRSPAKVLAHDEAGPAGESGSSKK